MEQKKLWDDLQKGILSKLYLLFGEEEYLVGFYAKAIESAAKKTANGAVFYKDVFEGARPVSDIIFAASSVPFEPGRRLVLVRDSKLFASGRKADSEAIADFLPNIPGDTIMVFAESDVDRRLRLFKKAQETGSAVNCERQTPQALAKWLGRQAKAKGVSLSADVASHIIATCGNSMTSLFFEMEKLTAYAAEAKIITSADVAEVAIPSLEARIFGLTKAMGQGSAKEALGHFASLMKLRESPLMVLTMIARQLRLMLLCKLGQQKSIPRAKLAGDLKVRDFVVSEALQQARRFSGEELLGLLRDCLDTDVKIKSGLLPEELGVEMLLARVAAHAKTPR